ncbi:MAG: phosphate ABC transporter permease subunit PstC [Planctomycetota bacterium]
MRRSRADGALVAALAAGAATAGSIVVLIFAFVAREAWPALRERGPLRFVTDEAWHPSDGELLLLPMVAGTLLTTLGALLLAGPLGIASGIFARFYAPARAARLYRRLVALLAGIPSVLFGLWGLVVLVPLVARLGGSGQGLLSATLVLALMILPTVAITADAALGAVPQPVLQGAAALGLGRWTIARRVAVPAARSGIATGLLLAAGRGLGETMAVLMVAGNVVQVPDGPLAPLRTVTANIALEMGYATEGHRSALFASGLALMVTVGALVVLVEWQRRRTVRA